MANLIIFNIGDNVDLMLNVTSSLATLIGETITIEINDIFGNLISTISGEHISDGLYAAVYSIPFNIVNLYNPLNEDQSTQMQDVFTLKDKWILPNNESIEYTFYVSKLNQNDPIEDNSKITISLSGILDIDSIPLEEDIEVEFTTTLLPYYGNIESVRSYNRNELSDVDDIDMARDILEWSRYVDLNMRPDIIKYQDTYDNAVSGFVSTTVAKYILLPILNVNQETKQLDTFSVSRTSGGAEYMLKRLDELIENYEQKVYAGGADCFYQAKTFIKGLLDPNRPNLSRGTLDVSDAYPWVNTETKSMITQIDGVDTEIRGERTIQFRSIFRLPPTSITRLNETSF